MKHLNVDNRRRTANRGTLAAGAAVLGLVLAFSLVPTAAHAAGSKSIGGNINCNLVPNVMIGTESTTRGTAVEHRLNAPSSAAAKQTVNLGSSSAYAPWGWTFWFQQSGSFIATGYGTYGGVVAGSLNRYCRFN